jgi:hypothetical protein
LTQHPIIIDRAAYDSAQELLTLFGRLAPLEANARANQSRDVGNIVHYCRWRSVGRLIEALADDPEGMTLH